MTGPPGRFRVTFRLTPLYHCQIHMFQAIQEAPVSNWTVADVISKISIAVIGAAWTILTYVRGRTFRRRLEPSVSGEILVNNGTYLLSVRLSIKNVGLSRANVIQRGTWLRISLLSSKHPADQLQVPSKFLIGTAPVFKKHSWVEPGEEIHDVKLVQIPDLSPDKVAVSLELRVVSDELSLGNVLQTSSEAIVSEEDAGFILRKRLAWNAGAVVSLRDTNSQVGGMHEGYQR